jgi:SAM-dependent methyltransferase
MRGRQGRFGKLTLTMSDSVFGQTYADQYDLLYGDKDYEAECNLLEEVFRRDACGPVKTILDLGCGTGSHAIPLARRGYQVTGVDLSSDMLVHAGEKAAGTRLPEGSAMPMFVQGDVRSVDLGRQFDAVLMMFAVLGYQLTNDDVLATLRTVRRHLKPGGLFVCDVWYGPAVLAIRPGDRVKLIPLNEGNLIRTASSMLDIPRHLCEIHYHLWHLEGDRVLSETEEVHRMRFFFPLEMEMALTQTGLTLRSLTTVLDLGCPSDETTWNVLAVAEYRQNGSK